MGQTHSQFALGRPKSPTAIVYKPEGFKRAQGIKKEMDDVLDNLKGLVTHVVQREEMKIRQHTGPQMNNARLKIVSQE